MWPGNKENHARFLIMYKEAQAIEHRDPIQPMQTVKYSYNIKVLFHLLQQG